MVYETTSTLTKSILQAVLFVADNLLHQRAVLLPQVCQVFLQTHSRVEQASELVLEVDNTLVKFTSRWLLHQLILYLNSFMEYKCEHRRIGTVLFRKGGNLFTSLSLSSNVEIELQAEDDADEDTDGDSETETEEDEEMDMEVITDCMIGELIYDQVEI